MKRFILGLGFLLFCVSLSLAQLSQEETFGKNRVQYHKNFKYWWKYETQNFMTYWYTPARKAAESAILYAEEDYHEIQALLEHHINDKIQIIVFADLTDLKQSNLGTSEIFETTLGQTKVEGNRIFVYSDGNHKHLRHQIRKGIASVHIAQMLQGSTIQEIVQNAFLSTLPEWYVNGLVSYIGEPFDYAFERDIRSYFQNTDDGDFISFAKKNPTLAGHAMWSYIYTKYGRTNLSNLLYFTRIRRKLDKGFSYVLGIPFEQVALECYHFYESAYRVKESAFVEVDYPEIKIRKKKVAKIKKGKFNMKVSSVSISPNNEKLIYVTNEIGKYRTWVVDTKTNKQLLLMKGGFRNPFQQADYNYPHYSWINSSTELYGVHEKHDKIYLTHWNLENGESLVQEFPPKIERIYSMDVFSRDTLLLSASTDGYTDLYFYTPKTRQFSRLTNDYFDDLDAKVAKIAGSRYIVFSSNRTNTTMETQKLDTTLPDNEYDLYLMSPITKFTQKLTNTHWATESNPVVVGSTIHYISNANGIRNRWSVDVAAASLAPLMHTQYKLGVDEFDRTKEFVVECVDNFTNPKIRMFSAEEEPSLDVVYSMVAKLKRGDLKVETSSQKEEVAPEENKLERKFYFQTKYKDEIPLPEDIKKEVQNEESLLILSDYSNVGNLNNESENRKKFNPARVLAYRMTFGMTDFDFDINNEVLFSGLNTFTGFKRGFEFPDPGILVKVESRDLFENYIVSGGMRIPLKFNGSEFFLAIEDRKYQLDKKIAFYRRSFKERDDERFEGEPNTRNSTHIGVLELKYPLSIFSSFRLTTSVRYDRTIFLPTSSGELNRDNLDQQRVGMRLEYVFDNSYQTLPNILHGSRAKIYIEASNKFRLQVDPWTFDLSQAFMTVIGIDARHYVRLDRHSIFAVRFAGATSFGSEKILYYLGGVKNWISPDYNSETPFPASNDFAFEAATTDMRGFKQNIRNGSSYVLGNAELRIPLFNYLSPNRRLKSNFLRNFQVIGFFDAGTAWHGNSPTSGDNPLNSETITNATSIVNVRYFRDPLVFGYGAGARLNLLGYFVRLDYAWGFETRRQTDPIFYFSLGHDF